MTTDSGVAFSRYQCPDHFPRRVLLAATGLSPQVVTETLYALAVTRQPAFIPTEVHILTTAEGANHAELTLLHPHQSRFQRFCGDYGLTGQIRFDTSQIHTIDDELGRPLTDISTPEENTFAANAITALVRSFTADTECALHVSIAGGRKTMGFYLGYALSLFGRPQDRLSHVLVSYPFESNQDFYYPPAEPEVLFTRENKPIHTSDAKITLAEIPFVRLRHGLPENLLEGGASFSEAVQSAQQAMGEPALALDYANRTLDCSGKRVALAPQLFAFYAWLALRRKDAKAPVRYTDADPREFLAEYRKLVGELAHDYEAVAAMLAEGMTKEFFDEKKSRINATLKRQLGIAAQPYLIQAEGKRPVTRFGLKLETRQIVIT